MWANERALRSDEEIRAGLAHIWEEMQSCVNRGLETEGTLPGGLKVRRRAPMLYRRLNEADSGNLIATTLGALDWVDLWALAVNEENAAGGRVVTAPTNGAAGIVPAVLHYYARYDANANAEASSATCSPPPPSASCANSTLRFPALKSVARAKWAQPAPWPLAVSRKSSAAAWSRWKTPPRSAWSTTSG